VCEREERGRGVREEPMPWMFLQARETAAVRNENHILSADVTAAFLLIMHARK
jgi:hypothetical protein